jgi:hypothetical protein
MHSCCNAESWSAVRIPSSCQAGCTDTLFSCTEFQTESESHPLLDVLKCRVFCLVQTGPQRPLVGAGIHSAFTRSWAVFLVKRFGASTGLPKCCEQVSNRARSQVHLHFVQF